MTFNLPNFDDTPAATGVSGLLAKSSTADFAGAKLLGSKGTGAAGTTAYKFTPTRTFTWTTYRVYLDTAITAGSSGAARLCVWAADGTTRLTKSSTNGDGVPIANTVTVNTATSHTILSASLTADGGANSITFTQGTSYWVGMFLNANAATGAFASLYAPSFFGTSLAAATGVFLSGTGTPTSLTGAVVDPYVIAIGFS